MPPFSSSRAQLAPTIRSPLVAKASRNLRDCIRYMRSRATRMQTDAGLRNYAKALLSSDRAKDIERLVALSIDAIDRGASIETAELPWRLGLATVRFHATQGHVVGSIGELCMIETVAQSRLEQAECAFSHDQTNPLLARAYMEARMAYFRDSGPLSEAAERVAATG